MKLCICNLSIRRHRVTEKTHRNRESWRDAEIENFIYSKGQVNVGEILIASIKIRLVL